MKCPHCLESFHGDWTPVGNLDDVRGKWILHWDVCPACSNMMLALDGPNGKRSLVHPKGVARAPLPPEVPQKYATDYKEACLVLEDSPKASAALSRRCLQDILRDVLKIKPANLAQEIQEVLDSGKLPSYLAEQIDGVRNVGNFAAHPIKSEHTREIIDVEPQEAEWLLDTLEVLFDFCFVQPAQAKKRREALNKKLKDAGKPPMK